MECDVHLTADNVVLVAHDADFKRLCGVDKTIEETEYANIPPILKKFSLHFNDTPYELKESESGKFCTLRELFEIAPNSIIGIDCKGAKPILKDLVRELIKEFKRERITVWGSMTPKN